MTTRTIRKTLTIEKADEAGLVVARIATLSAVDSDGDTYAPGAFSWKDGGQQWAVILPAHDRRATPLGKVRVYEEAGAAMAEMHFNLDVPAAQAWHSAIKFDLAKGRPVQEYSYGFQIMDAGFEQRDGVQVRVLKKLDVDEVSPVVRGAGVGTGTISAKAALKDEHFGGLIGTLDEMAQALTENPALLSAIGRKQLAEIHAVLGKALVTDSGDDRNDDGEKATAEAAMAAAETAMADFLRFQSRRHLTA